MKVARLLLILLLPSCGLFNKSDPHYHAREERLKIRMALEDYYDTQAEFARIYAGQIREFERYQRP